MSFNRIVARLSNAFGEVRPASRIVLRGIDTTRPVPEAVRRLGMDPRAFLSIGHG
ncbi:hypothetical protein HNP73_004043 [Amaricoccus macauensis]|mgnify:FL=1|uniref:Uncharacterized protein n=1 Tax=Amaricoccus macauensis TaxID=57001 RepID=A0A840SYE1_9RHOB|nr:hypothetical protein [Amaricoccus macauensis]MBB5224082.1 hypothetical protein [Amaricoccus macauensis]